MLRQQKSAILHDWLQRIFGSRFEIRDSRFEALQSQIANPESQDRFANPVSYAFRVAAEAICDAVINDRDVDRGSIEYAMKIKAVQGSDASEAISFIQILKAVVRDMLADTAVEQELTAFESRIDGIAAVASEMFLANRSRIAEIAHGNNSRARSL